MKKLVTKSLVAFCTGVILAAIATYTIMVASTPKEICVDYSDEEVHELEVALIESMTNKYQSAQRAAIAEIYPDMLPDDARAVFFDFVTIKEFLYQIEVEAGEHDVKPDELGIRVYYASYPKRSEWGEFSDLITPGSDGTVLPITYENRHTLIMIPAFRKSKDEIWDFDPSIPETLTRPLGGVISDSKASGMSIIGLTGTPRVLSKNHGSLWPPNPESELTF